MQYVSGKFLNLFLVVSFLAGCSGTATFKDFGTAASNAAGASVDSPIAGIDFSAVGAGESHSCALSVGGAIYCWGDNTYGQLGLGATSDSKVWEPTIVPGFTSGVTALGVGFNHSCAVKSGVAYCWGLGTSKQLGYVVSGSQNFSPKAVSGMSDVTKLSLGRVHSCAIDGGKALCWGGNDFGVIGSYTTEGQLNAVPGDPGGGAVLDSNVKDISVSEFHSCALKSDNSIYCWGRDSYGETGEITGFSSREGYDYLMVPALVSGSYSYVSISLGNVISCGLLTDGTIRCWGTNFGSSYMVGSLIKAPSVPLPLSILPRTPFK